MFIVIGQITIAQDTTHKSIHQQQLEYYNSLGHADASYYEQHTSARTMTKRSTRANCNLNKVVYGWHPYWSGNTYQNYDWDLLSHFSFFSYEVSPSTGNASTTHGWATSSAVDAALASGNTKVTLTVTLFSGHATFFGSSSAQQTLITNLINLIQSRGADGVNIDFEGLPAAHKTNFANFMVNLSNQMHAAIPNSDVSTVLYAVDWSNVFDFSIMAGAVDHFIIMGYDYYYKGSANSGPNDPLYHFGSTYNYNISKSITEYLFKGCPQEKLILGLPYYGHDWPTSSTTVPSSTTAYSTSRFYNDVKDNVTGNFTAGNHQYDNDSYTDIYVYNSGGPRQCFITLEDGFRKRLEHINNAGIGGMGIWALGYDDGYTDFWVAIDDYMTDCYSSPCSGTITDFCGPRDYYNHENYTWTVAPDGASSITLNFTSFNVESNYDYLYIYDGSTSSAAQVPGSPFTGTTLPPTITSSTGALTFKFTSDGATTKPGFKANYTCNSDITAPSTTVSAPIGWQTDDFEVDFIDADEPGGSGIAKSFYQVLYYDGTSWKANPKRGFFGDNFDGTNIDTNWTSETGTWGITTSNVLAQTDATEGNANIYAHLTQNLSNRYLYTWQGKISGSDENKRAGFHFFCDDASLSNRGNSYLVYFRAGGNSDPNNNNKVQIYKSTNNDLELKQNISYTINPDQMYSYKISFDRITGEMIVYIDGNIAATWTDLNPYSNGDAVSFRSGSCDCEFDNLKVYRSRYPNVTVTVGPGTNTDVPFQNPNSNTPSAKIKSIAMDNAKNLSTIGYQFVNIDWTAPLGFNANDGTGGDIDSTTTNSELSANWETTTDPHSNVVAYEYAIGTSIGDSDVVDWIDNGLSTSITHTGMALNDNVEYFFSIRAKNGAGLYKMSSTDGQWVVLTTDIEVFDKLQIQVYPNPLKHQLNIELKEKRPTSLVMYDSMGKMVFEKKINASSSIDLTPFHLSAGNYNLKIKSGENNYTVQLIKQ